MDGENISRRNRIRSFILLSVSGQLYIIRSWRDNDVCYGIILPRPDNNVIWHLSSTSCQLPGELCGNTYCHCFTVGSKREPLRAALFYVVTLHGNDTCPLILTP